MFAKLSTRGVRSVAHLHIPRIRWPSAGWNFSKYVIGKDGKVVAFFPSAVTPDRQSSGCDYESAERRSVAISYHPPARSLLKY